MIQPGAGVESGVLNRIPVLRPRRTMAAWLCLIAGLAANQCAVRQNRGAAQPPNTTVAAATPALARVVAVPQLQDVPRPTPVPYSRACSSILDCNRVPSTRPAPSVPRDAVSRSAVADRNRPSGADEANSIVVEVVPPKLLSKVEPQYTLEGRQANAQGNVILQIVVQADGSVGEVTVVRGLGYGLDENAIEAVRKWTFEPPIANGAPVPFRVTVAVTFLPPRDVAPSFP